MSKITKLLDDEFVEATKEAEKKNDMKPVKKGNALKHRSEESVEDRKKLEEALKFLEENKAKL